MLLSEQELEASAKMDASILQSTVKITKPANPPAGGAPLVVFAFGGGWIGGDVDVGTPVGRMLTSAFGAVVVLLGYRLAPENKFPRSHLDAWESVKWIANNASQLGADPSKGFIMSGISAGGCIAAAVVTKAIEEPLAYPFTGQWLGVPTILDPDHTPEKYRKYHLSLKHNAEAPVLGKGSMDAIQRHIEADANSPWRWPILSPAPLAKQPKAFIQVDGMDPLRDDGLIWDEILKDNGVETRCKFYPGCPHAHWSFFLGIDVSNQAVVDIVQGVGWLLGNEPTVEEVMQKCF